MRAPQMARTFAWSLIGGCAVGYLCLYFIGPADGESGDVVGRRAEPVRNPQLESDPLVDSPIATSQPEPLLSAVTQEVESESDESLSPPVPAPIIPTEILERWGMSEYFAEHFASESVDASWAPGMEAQILDSFAQVSGVTFSQIQTHCRRTMCRIEVMYQPDTDFDESRPRNYYHELLSDRIKSIIRNGGTTGRVNSLSTADLNYDVPDPRADQNNIGPSMTKAWISYAFNRSSLPPPAFLQGAP